MDASQTEFHSQDPQKKDNLKISYELNDSILHELQAVRSSYLDLQSKHTAMEEELVILQQRNDEALNHLTEVSSERDDLRHELKVYGEKFEELLRENNVSVLSETLEGLRLAKECLARVIESLDGNKQGCVVEEREKNEQGLELSEELRDFSKFASAVESKLSEYQETRKKEKRQLEDSLVSLTEDNRDVNTLLRIALMEKEGVEKTLNRLKGNSEQKRGVILQIAERGLHKVGFGFIMGTGTNEPPLDNSGASTSCNKSSDSSECEEGVVSLAFTVERIMKNLRREITQLRISLDESRSDTERLQSLTEKQAQKLIENTMYIKELEDREMMLAQNVEELLLEIKETEEEVGRWREACVLEAEAGKNAIDDRDKMVAILKLELEKTKAALEISNGKLKVKEELASAAMAAQASAERSLLLADSRVAGFHERIEELTRQLEEAGKRERNNRKRMMRHICWPWHAFKLNPTNNSTSYTVRNSNRRLPEMQALLH